MTSDALKRRHELSIATLFAVYLQSTGVTLTDLRNGDPSLGEPDVVAATNQQTCGIEIADGWMSQGDAKAVWTVARGERSRAIVSSSGAEIALSPLIVGPDQQLGAALQVQLEAHARRDYGMPTYLVLNGSYAPLTSAEDAPTILAALHVPIDSRMTGVYLVLTRNFSYLREFFAVT